MARYSLVELVVCCRGATNFNVPGDIPSTPPRGKLEDPWRSLYRNMDKPRAFNRRMRDPDAAKVEHMQFGCVSGTQMPQVAKKMKLLSIVEEGRKFVSLTSRTAVEKAVACFENETNVSSDDKIEGAMAATR